MNYRQIARVFGWLLWRDLFVLKKNFFNKLIDAVLWSVTNIIISNYILPSFGIDERFGLLIWVGTIVTMSYFEAGYAAQELLADQAGNNHLGYLLTLPLPTWLVFIKIAFGIACNCMVLSICMLPIGKVVLGSRLNLSTLNVFQFTFMFLAINLFCGFFSIWIFSWAKNTTRFSEVWRRVLNPLWAFGGYQFTWHVLHKTYPRVAMVNLLNPITYAFEGLRASVLGQGDFMPVWICFAMLVSFIVVLAYWSINWIKKRLDYV